MLIKMRPVFLCIDIQCAFFSYDILIILLGGLPPTAYVKMVDIWLIFAQMVPFFEVEILLLFFVLFNIKPH